MTEKHPPKTVQSMFGMIYRSIYICTPHECVYIDTRDKYIHTSAHECVCMIRGQVKNPILQRSPLRSQAQRNYDCNSCQIYQQRSNWSYRRRGIRKRDSRVAMQVDIRTGTRQYTCTCNGVHQRCHHIPDDDVNEAHFGKWRCDHL